MSGQSQELEYPHNTIKTVTRGIVLSAYLFNFIYLQARNFYALFTNSINQYYNCSPGNSSLVRYCERAVALNPMNETSNRFYIAMSSIYVASLLIAGHQLFKHPLSPGKENPEAQRRLLLKGNFKENHVILFYIHRMLIICYIVAMLNYFIMLDLAKKSAISDCVQTDETPTTWVCEEGDYDHPDSSLALTNFILSITLGLFTGIYGINKIPSFTADVTTGTKAALALCFGRDQGKPSETIALTARQVHDYDTSSDV